MNTHPLRRAISLIISSDLILPAVLLVSYAVFLFFIRGILPTSEELLNLFAKYYAQHGYQIIFVAALLESLVIINLFAPGQVALALGIIFSRTGETSLPLVMLTVACGFLVGFTIDYFIGYYGLGDILNKFGQGAIFEKAKNELKKNGGRSIFISFINPNLGSYISLSAGAAKLEITLFGLIGLFSILFWVVSWSLLIYSLGDIVLLLIKKYSLIFSVIFIGILIISVTWRGNKK